jgi:hypothetical protein
MMHLTSLKASAVDSYGIGARTIALGNATVAGESGAFAAFFNPAAICRTKTPLVALNLINTNLALKDINLPSGDLPSGLPADTYKASSAEPITGTSLGINFPLTKSVSFGLAGYMPSNNFGRLWGGSPSDTFYLRTGDRQQRPAIYTALSARLPAGFSIGAGTYYTLKADGRLQMALASEGSAARFELDMKPVTIMYGGIEWQHSWDDKSLSMGVTYRARQAEVAKIDTNLTLNFDSASLPLGLTTSLAPFFDPETIRAGVNYKVAKHSLYASAEYARWSAYKAPQVNLGGEDLSLVSAISSPSEVSLNDTWAYKFGYEYAVPGIATAPTYLRAGYAFHESANRFQKVATIIDPSRQSVSLGVGIDLPKQWMASERKASIDFSFQASKLANSTTEIVDGSSSYKITPGGQTNTFIGGLQYEL